MVLVVVGFKRGVRDDKKVLASRFPYLLFPVPISFLSGFAPFFYFYLQFYVMMCSFLNSSRFPCHLWNPASLPYFSRLPYRSCPLFSITYRGHRQMTPWCCCTDHRQCSYVFLWYTRRHLKNKNDNFLEYQIRSLFRYHGQNY